MAAEFYLHIKVQAGARREKIVEKDSSRFEIAVRERAEHNEANEKILTIVRDKFPRARVTIVKGQRSPNKLLKLVNIKS